jgi:hypothetical protein
VPRLAGDLLVLLAMLLALSLPQLLQCCHLVLLQLPGLQTQLHLVLVLLVLALLPCLLQLNSTLLLLLDQLGLAALLELAAAAAALVR